MFIQIRTDDNRQYRKTVKKVISNKKRVKPFCFNIEQHQDRIGAKPEQSSSKGNLLGPVAYALGGIIYGKWLGRHRSSYHYSINMMVKGSVKFSLFWKTAHKKAVL